MKDVHYIYYLKRISQIELWIEKWSGSVWKEGLTCTIQRHLTESAVVLNKLNWELRMIKLFIWRNNQIIKRFSDYQDVQALFPSMFHKLRNITQEGEKRNVYIVILRKKKFYLLPNAYCLTNYRKKNEFRSLHLPLLLQRWIQPSRYEIVLCRSSVKFAFVTIYFDQMNQFFTGSIFLQFTSLKLSITCCRL